MYKPTFDPTYLSDAETDGGGTFRTSADLNGNVAHVKIGNRDLSSSSPSFV